MSDVVVNDLNLGWLTLPLPPPDNQCHASGAYGRYPKRAYREWLEIAHPLIQEWLGEDWVPDTDSWWSVDIALRLGARAGDAQNYEKALFDALSGKCIVKGGKIQQGRGLWDDDKRIAYHTTLTVGVRAEEPEARIYVQRMHAPPDERAQRIERERAEKAAAREAARAEKAAAKAMESRRRHLRRPLE